MTEAGDPVRAFLEGRGCPDHVVQGGFLGLVESWEKAAQQVSAGYPLGLDDYLNDLDGRQLLEEALPHASDRQRALAKTRIGAADARFRSASRLVPECLWGSAIAEMEGWSPDDHWWYFSVPKQPGPLLREDLEGS